jgi:tetratricopeptide (TPR) repeat protein
MKKNLALLLLFSFLFSFSFARQKPAEGQATLIFTHATIIDTAGGPNKTDMTVFINGDRITDIKKTGKVRPAKGAQVIDATGKFLIPGLWDMHVHCNDIRDLPLFIANGVTGVRVMWGFPMHHAWREEISKGSLIGPRMVIGSPLIDGPKPVWPGSITVSNEADARQVVRQMKEIGYDFIKVYQLLPREAYFAIADESKKLGISFAGHLPSSISAIEASNAGQRSIEHLASVPLGILLACSSKEEELYKTREKAFEGVSRQQPRTPSQLEAYRSFANKTLETYDDEKASVLFALFVKNSTWQCPTLTVLRSYRYLDDKNFTNDARLKYMPKAKRESWELKNNPSLSSDTAKDWAVEKKVYRKELALVGAMHRAGVKLLAGTDTGNPYCFPGFSLHDELGLLVEAGLTPMEALQAATYNAAEFLGQLDSLGTVETGKIADLVLLEADPLEDIGNTKKIAAVVFRGKYYPRSSLDEMLAKIEILANQTPIAEVMLKTITEKDISSAIQQYHELKAAQPDAYDFRELQLDSLGYQLLKMKKINEAIEIFKLNVEVFPQSYNVYGSLAEAYMISGDKELAIKNYEKSLELNPENSNAVEMLKKLRTE